jgi:hypothetical protein
MGEPLLSAIRGAGASAGADGPGGGRAPSRRPASGFGPEPTGGPERAPAPRGIPGPDQGARQLMATVACVTLSARRRVSSEASGASETAPASRRSVASQAQEL